MTRAELERVYISTGCNRSPNCLAWREDLLLYASCDSVVVAARSSVGEGPLEAIATLCGHSARVNCVRWVEGENGARYFTSASADGTAAVWTRKRKDGDEGRVSFEKASVLKGHSEGVTVSGGVEVESSSILVATTSSDCTIRTWLVDPEQQEAADHKEKTRIDLGRGMCMDLRVVLVGRLSAMLMAAMEDCRVHLFGGRRDGGDFSFSHALHGHEDWVRCLDVVGCGSGGDLLLASGGQDGFVRVWKLVSRNQAEPDLQTGPPDDRQLKMKEELFEIRGEERSLQFAVKLETILAGHEDKVFAVQWRKTSFLALLTASLDKTMIIWSPPEEKNSDHQWDEQVWTETVRLGEMGGNTLGFLGAQLDPRAAAGGGVLGYSFSGAFHGWEDRGEGVWRPVVQPGGHSGQVSDIAWEEGGRYLLSAGADQTTRVHAPWECESGGGRRHVWREVARPQVHGHDLACLCSVRGHRLASGAEEKVVRVFEATSSFVENLGIITGRRDSPSSSVRRALVQGASVPSLGLSNKAVLKGQTVTPEAERHVKDKFPDHYFKPEKYDCPPPEEALAQNTLWPELHKLYGHGYDIFSLASDHSGRLLASACKATKAEHAEVLLWEEDDASGTSWRIRQRLRGHNLTVTQIEFSPCDVFLLTVSRDRTWALFEKEDDGNYVKVAHTDKQTSVHQRLIWSCAWTGDSKYFATSSRDKKVAVWGRRDTTRAEGKSPSSLGDFALACARPLQVEDSATALAVAPATALPGEGTYLLAVGLENGKILLVEWAEKIAGGQEEGEEEWRVLLELDRNRGHHKAVQRLRFKHVRQKDEGEGEKKDGLFLASCSTDHAVKVFCVLIS